MIHEAVRETMQRIETSMETRLRGKDDEGNERDGDQNRTTGNMLYGSFVHRETRPIDGIPDPHFHIHCYTFNATYDPVEARWKAGQFGNIKRDGPLYEAIFHERLAEKDSGGRAGLSANGPQFRARQHEPGVGRKVLEAKSTYRATGTRKIHDSGRQGAGAHEADRDGF